LEVLVQVLVSGILVGGLYGIISSGLSLSFGISKIANFAHADYITVGMYLAVVVIGSAGSWGLLLIPVWAAVVGFLGLLVYVLLLRRQHLAAKTEDEAHLPQVVITAAVSTFIQSLLLSIFTSTDRQSNSILSGTWNLAGLSLPISQVVAFFTSLAAFIALDVVVTRTEFGRGLRAIVDDPEAAEIVGVNPGRALAISIGIGTGLAGLAGGLLATYQTVNPTVGFSYLPIAFVTVILGGLGSIRGAFIAGLIVGIVQQATGTYVSLDAQNIAVWLLFLVVLLVRPNGLLGQKVQV
jgi:branched-chain amino acid transport system permease protein